MSDLAIDRFKVSAEIEARAQETATHLSSDPATLVGWLSASIATFLERPVPRGRARLAEDLRASEIAWYRDHHRFVG